MQKTSTTKKAGAQTHASNGTPKKQSATQTPKRSSANSKGTASDSKLEEFFVEELKDIYWAEKKLVSTLPKMQKAASTEELQTAFANHLEETKGHVERLEQVFDMLGHKAQAKKCEAMEGITEEGNAVIEDTEDGTATRDVALIMAGQKAEHYEIATYGGLAQLARTLGHDDAAELLEATLEEEKNADQLLTSIAEDNVNYEAASETEDNENNEEAEETEEEEE